MQTKMQNWKKQNMLFYVEYHNSEYLILFFQPGDLPACRCLSVASPECGKHSIPGSHVRQGDHFLSRQSGCRRRRRKKNKIKKRGKRRRCDGDVSEVFPPVISGLPPLRFPRVNPVISATQAQ